MSLTRKSQNGSALLIVFVFAAILAISLYSEMPVTLFEAKRQKEQLLVDRGHEYVRAIQVFYRANHGQFPASIDQLMSTNNVRYLRRRYKDPFTGKDDWRLLHAGAGGVLIDSKVTPVGLPGVPGQPGSSLGSGFSNGSAAGSNTTGQSSFTAAKNDTDPDALVVAPVAQRPPAVGASGGVPAAGAAGAEQNPDAPLLPSASEMEAAVNGQPAARTTNPAAATAAGAPVQIGPGAKVMETMGPLLNSPTGQVQPNAALAAGSGNQAAGGFGQSGLGQMNGGGALAGIASKAKGHSIKHVNDQDDYSLWEFHYDPTKDTGLGGIGAGGGVPGMSATPGFANPGNNNPGNNNPGSNNPGTANPGFATPASGGPQANPPPAAGPGNGSDSSGSANIPGFTQNGSNPSAAAATTPN